MNHRRKLAWALFGTALLAGPAMAQGRSSIIGGAPQPIIGRPAHAWPGGQRPSSVFGPGKVRTATFTGVVSPGFGGHGHHHHHHHRRYYVPVYYPSLYSLGYYGGYSGIYPPSYDPYSNVLVNENEALRRQLEALAKQNQALANQANPPVKVEVPLRDAKERRGAEEKVMKWMIDGTKAFSIGRYSQAAEKYRQAARLATDDASPRFLLAQALFAMRKYSEAVDEIKAGLKLNPDWLEVEFDVRSLYDNPEDLDAQLSHLAKLLKANPLDRNSHFLLGYELFVSGEMRKSQTILEHTARLEPDDAHLKPFFDYFEKQLAANLP